MFLQPCAGMVRWGAGRGGGGRKWVGWVGAGGESYIFCIQKRARGVEGLGNCKDNRHSNIITEA